MTAPDPARRKEIAELGARTRWGPQRRVRLDQLDPAVAAAVRALLEADRAAKKAGSVIETSEPATSTAGIVSATSTR